MRTVTIILNLICILSFSPNAIGQNSTVKGQDIDGRWEGLMNDEILQMNLIRNNDILCGYTYDYKINDPNDHCKAYFTARFSAEINAWILDGNEFIENSGTHVFMQIRFREKTLNGKKVLHGIVLPQSAVNQGANMNYIEVFLNKKELPSEIREQIRKRCFPTRAELKKEEKKKKTELPPKKPEPTPVEEPIAIPIPIPPPATPPTETERVEEMNNRKKAEVKTLSVSTRNINIKVYDNGIIDDDTVTIYYNNRLLVDKKRLSDKPIEFNIELDDRPGDHEIIMYAENLGSIPPNTALVVATAGDKRYELYSSASLVENAVLRFRYIPDK